MTEHLFNILFLSNRNTTRGIFAEAVANRKVVAGSRRTVRGSSLRPIWIPWHWISSASLTIRPRAYIPSTGRNLPVPMLHPWISFLRFAIPMRASRCLTGRADQLQRTGLPRSREATG